MPARNVLPIILVGADPEAFVREKKSGKIVSAHDLLPGTKEAPFPVKDGAIQVDGLAAEFNTTPANSGQLFEATCHNVIAELKKKLGPKYELVFEPAHVFEQDYYDSLPEETKILGCTADFNGYTRDINPPPMTEEFPTMRTTSGHLHGGWASQGTSFDVEDPAHVSDCAAMARQMDYALGIVSLIWDPDPRRRLMYGKAGCFRPKSYGFEYRALSDVWLRPDIGKTKDTVDWTSGGKPKVVSGGLITWIGNRFIAAAQDLFKGVVYENGPWDKESARHIIDNNITDWMYRPEFKKLASMTQLPPVKMPEDPNAKKSPTYYTEQVVTTTTTPIWATVADRDRNV